MPNLRSLPLAFGIITCRTGTGWKIRDFNSSRTCCRNASTPIPEVIRATVARSTPGVRAPLFPATRSHAIVRNAGSQTRLYKSSNRRSRSVTAQQCSLVCILRTAKNARASLGHPAALVFTDASSDITVPSCFLSLPPFPMRPALPASEYYDGSAPPTPFGRQRTYPHQGNEARVVPTFTAVRLTGEVPGFAPAASSWLRRRPSPRPAGPDTYHRSDSSPPRTVVWLTTPGAVTHRTPARIHRVRAGRRSRGFTTPVPHVHLPVLLTRPGPSGSTGPS